MLAEATKYTPVESARQAARPAPMPPAQRAAVNRAPQRGQAAASSATPGSSSRNGSFCSYSECAATDTGNADRTYRHNRN